ncbi:MAG: ABC transporter permease [Lachnospiraceae bacterium]|nr:ABC transporter permease [Lachnospiraceae bacterium]
MEKKKLTQNAGFQSFVASLVCILGGLLVGAIVLVLLAAFNNDIPISEAFRGIGIVLAGPFSSGSASDILFNFGDMLLEATPILMTGLAVAIAFKTGLFNIGAPGQFLMGATGALLTALSIPTTEGTKIFVWLLALLVGMLCGALWGAIPGIFKAVFKVNEVIVCIMCNWIAANVVSWIFYSTGDKYINIAETKVKFIRPTLSNNVATPRMGLDKVFPGSNIDIGIFIAIILAILIYILLNKTKLGFELKAGGFNTNAAKYSGMNGTRNIILSMVIAGALAGGGAALWYLNGKNDFLWNTYSSLPNEGFNGIPVALLASNNPIGVIFTSIFLRYIGKGGFNLAGYTMFNEYVSNLIIAVIIYFAGASKFIRDWMFNRKKKGVVRKADNVVLVDDLAGTVDKANAAAGDISPGDSGDPPDDVEGIAEAADDVKEAAEEVIETAEEAAEAAADAADAGETGTEEGGGA